MPRLIYVLFVAVCKGHVPCSGFFFFFFFFFFWGGGGSFEVTGESLSRAADVFKPI